VADRDWRHPHHAPAGRHWTEAWLVPPSSMPAARNSPVPPPAIW
jgi:hypothetical protein